VSSHKDGTQSFFKAHLKLFVGLVLVVLIGASAVGAVLFYFHYIGSERAFKNLHAALGEGNKAVLATMIDFRSLSEDFVRAVLVAYPLAAANETQQAELQDEAQRLVLKAMAGEKSGKPETAAPRKLFEPVRMVPEDVIAQVAAGLKLDKTSSGAPIWSRIKSGEASGGVQISSRFTHNGLQTDFPLRLLMERRRGGWQVTRLLNAQEIVGLYKGATDAIRAADEAKLAEQNEKIMARMRAHFNSPQCTAAVNMVSDKQEAMLVVKVTADNTDTTTLHHVNLQCDVRVSSGALIFSRQLNVVQRVYSGGAFSNVWTVLLEAKSEEAVRLLQAGPLSCTVEPRVMSVGMGEILYPRKED
jgi:hypothetical protein